MITCTIIKSGRTDEYGRVLNVNSTYTGNFYFVRDLVNSGYATVLDRSVFDDDLTHDNSSIALFDRDSYGNVIGLLDGDTPVGLTDTAKAKLQNALKNISSPYTQKVMTTPPTVTLETVGANAWTPALGTVFADLKIIRANKNISSADRSVANLDERISFGSPNQWRTILPGQPLLENGSLLMDTITCKPNETLSYAGGLPNIKFVTDSPYFGIYMQMTSDLRIFIDGELLQSGINDFTVAGGTRYYATLNFAGVRKERHIEIVGVFNLCTITMHKNDTISPGPKSNLKVVGEGDSYLQVASTFTPTGSIFYDVFTACKAEYMAFPIGGTGYIQTPDPVHNPNAITRVQNLIDAHNNGSDVVCVALGINDSTTVNPTFTAGVNTYYATLHAALPRAMFIVFGAWYPNSLSGNVALYKVVNQTIFAAVRASGAQYIIVDNLNNVYETSWGTSGVLGSAESWQTGSGTIAAPNGTGNGDYYISADATHPNAAGAEYLATRLFNAIKTAVFS